MENHHLKPRDMARSALASTRRKGARDDRRLAHRLERARLRREIHDLRSHVVADDYDGDLTWTARSALASLVEDRRCSDNTVQLGRWAMRTIDVNPVLVEASTAERLAYFRALLPDDVAGRHALGHLRWYVRNDTGRPRSEGDGSSGASAT